MSETVTEIERASEPVVQSTTSQPQNSSEPYVTLIEPHRGWRLVNVRELWRSRELLYFLALRDIKVRYKQTALGAAWAVLQPFMMMLVFTVFLGRLARVPSGDTPYPLFAYAGLLPWSFFATAVASAGNSVVGSERLITKIYFPRLAIPFAAVTAAVIDFCVAFLMLLAMMAWYRVVPTASMLFVPVVLALLMLTASGVGTLLAALNVSYRDFRYVIPFMLQLWMFATPPVYMLTSTTDSTKSTATASSTEAATDTDAATPASDAASARPRADAALPGWIKEALKLNPLTGMIAFFRAAVLGGELPYGDLLYSTAVSCVIFPIGCLYFRRVEDTFADQI